MLLQKRTNLGLRTERVLNLNSVNTRAIIPAATYRLQFNKGFTFKDAAALVPYLHALGITHIYASPFFRAVPGSLHGYDVCDHNQLNPEVGTREDLEAFAAKMRDHGLNLVLDFVPNHMGITEATNTWWMDVLENGPSSAYARFFDIDWHPVKRELENRILLPILGEQYGRVLEQGDLKLAFEHGVFRLEYQGRTLPIAPRTTLPLLKMAKERLHAAEHEIPPELESIILALDQLPPRTETDPLKIAIRAREKELIKGRLAKLCEENHPVHLAIADVVKEIQAGGPNQNFDAFDDLLQAQPYRLASWRVAAEEINYRRFFDINDLAAIRMELTEVFDATHRLILELLASEVVAGLRIDHVDGLFDPRHYFATLQESYAKISGTKVEDKPLYLLVEKILGPTERLRADWQVYGTTGYEAGAQLTDVLIDPAAEKAMTATYAKFLDARLSYAKVVYQSKILVMRVAMSSEVNVLGQMLNRISETNRWYRDFTLNALTTAIREMIACFPVYRTYLTPDGGVAPEDADVINRAIALARRHNPALDRSIFEFLRDVLMPPAKNSHPVDEEARVQFVMKLQQCTGPITAKGVEDTAFYIYNRLVALNEVGGEPHGFGSSVEVFHQKNIDRLKRFPHSLVATSTHDTKRSEDVRARIAAISELPQDWARAVGRWHRANQKHGSELDDLEAPDRNEEYLLYQTLLGTWPLFPMSVEERPIFIRRIQEYMIKATREAKVNSSWTEPNKLWENSVSQFVNTILTPKPGNRFLPDFESMAARIAELGMVNSLSQTVLKFTVPGVPDVYQGQELWDFSLVDPDNRRPVNYAIREKLLASLRRPPLATPDELVREWRDGRVKLLVTEKLLHLRRDHPDLFQKGAYIPLDTAGQFADCCIAFMREYEGLKIIVVVPRQSSRIGFPPLAELWKDTHLIDPPTCTGLGVFNRETMPIKSRLAVADLLTDFPVAVVVCH